MRIRLRRTVLTSVALALAACGQEPPPNAAVPAQDNSKIVQFLSASISWYRERAAAQKLATEPADVAFIQENARVADQVVQQAFDHARGEAQLQGRQRSAQQSSPAPASGATQHQGLTQAVQKVEQQIQDKIGRAHV